jgi:uncharacterized protein YraI
MEEFRMKRPAWLATIALLLALPFAALAADGYATGNVNLRAGPDVGYPRIDTIPAGAPVDIQGCTSGWEWCDVVFQGERGWVAGNFIQYEYDDRYVLVPQYGARIGIPIVTFVIGSYWDSHYRSRPFYRERARWYARPVPHRPPPRPAHRPVPPRRGAPLPHHAPPYHPVPPHRPAQPTRPVPDHHQRPMPQRPHATPRPAPHPAAPQRAGSWPHPAPSARAAGNARPTRPVPATHAPADHNGHAAAHGKPAASGKDDHRRH